METLSRAADFIWNGAGLLLLLGTGIYLTLRLRLFQLSHLRLWLSRTLLCLFSRRAGERDSSSISQRGALCTALAATVGVGNIAGVASALALGGAGAVFWMWVAALLGMATAYAENVLAIFYRKKNLQGELVGGAMFYLRDGLSLRRKIGVLGRPLSLLFSLFCVFSSFGIGNAGQVQAAVSCLSALPFLPRGKTFLLFFGIALALAVGAVILGGQRRIAAFTERLVPLMVIGYIAGALIIIFSFSSRIVPTVYSIFRQALAPSALAGGSAGAAISYGFRRGVFSNEAGMGSATIVNSAACTREPAEQGMWGIFQVFVDTIVMCTLTALAVLCSGVDTAQGDGARLVSNAFSLVFGDAGAVFVALSVLLFAFSSIIGWSFFGCRAWEFLSGRGVFCYKICFIGAIIPAALFDARLAWSICDLFNGLMLFPNLLGVLFLSPLVIKITENYLARQGGQNIKPLLSFYREGR